MDLLLGQSFRIVSTDARASMETRDELEPARSLCPRLGMEEGWDG